MQVTDTLIRNVVQEVLAHMKNGQAVTKSAPHKSVPTGAVQSGGDWGVFEHVDDAVKAATAAQREFEARGLDVRRKAVACIRKICLDKADMLGLEELEETKIGRLKHKVEKLVTCAEDVENLDLESGYAQAKFEITGNITREGHAATCPPLANQSGCRLRSNIAERSHCLDAAAQDANLLLCAGDQITQWQNALQMLRNCCIADIAVLAEISRC